jgi:hypothetical protein
MNIPKFTAEASLYRTSRYYRMTATFDDAYGTIYPAFSITDLAEPPGGSPFAYKCDVPGSRCCRPDASVKTRHCHKGLGCNTSTDQCEACGGPGQVCCDGDFTGFSRKSYIGFLLDPAERIASCNPGARCDAIPAADGVSWIGTRRCQSCGNNLAGPCCAPDNQYALGRCLRDAKTGNRLVCARHRGRRNDPLAGAGANCVECGKANQPRCLTAGERACDDGLVERHGMCVPCGGAGMPTCDHGEPCPDLHSVPDRSFTECLPAGGGKCCPDGMHCKLVPRRESRPGYVGIETWVLACDSDPDDNPWIGF